MADMTFAERIRERYPEGLTGVFAIGATRRTYILDQNRHAQNPGEIPDFAEQGNYLFQRYFDFIRMFYGLGGQNMIITALSFRSFFERGEEYAKLVVPEALKLMGDEACEIYRREGIDPYFIGIDTLLLLPPESLAHQMARQFSDFMKGWPYAEGRRKLLWEIASIPLLTFWQEYERLSDEERQSLESEINNTQGLGDVFQTLYKRFSRAAYGAEVPVPHFYLGTNMSGDLKWRSPMPMSLTGGDYIRMFYTPYPTLFMDEQAMTAMLDNLAFHNRFHSLKTDYKDRYSPELAEAEYQRIIELRANPDNILGLSRRVAVED